MINKNIGFDFKYEIQTLVYKKCAELKLIGKIEVTGEFNLCHEFL